MGGDPNRWFLGAPDAKRGVSPLFKENSVRSFIDAPEFYAELRKEIAFTIANPANAWFFWIGFELSGDVWMPGAPPASGDKKPYSPIGKPDGALTLLELLKAADDRGVQLRALLNLHPYPRDKDPTQPKRYERHNLKLCQTINRFFRNAVAINDFRYLLMNGTHHQKLFLISNAHGFTAYCGGLDLELSRIQYCWSDFHCAFQGEVVGYFYQSFRDRWAEHFKSLSPEDGFDEKRARLPDLSPAGGSKGDFMCQVTTTYGDSSRSNPFGPVPGTQPAQQNVNLPHAITVALNTYPGPFWQWVDKFKITIPLYTFGNDFFKGVDPAAPPLLKHARKQEPTYAFAPKGHHGIYDAIQQAISQAQRHIYLEDQYLVCDMPMKQLRSMLDLLKAKLADGNLERLVIFATRIDEINADFQLTGWKHRKNIIDTLLGAAKRQNQVIFLQYKSNRQLNRKVDPQGNSPFYVHSKTWIFDDELLISGSANCNRRGYSHDSELDFAICSPTTDFVQKTRMRLWRRRLFTEGFKGSSPPTDQDLADFERGCKYWLKPSDYTQDVESTAESGTKPFEPTDHPDATEAELQVNVSRLLDLPTGAPEITWKVSLYDFLWDYVVDPEGTPD